jgi:uncharacterized phage infection (PIP) family protein YhgE
VGGLTVETTRPLGLRGGLGRLSTGLIAYGIIGLVVAAIGLGALVWVNGRIGNVRSEAGTTVAQLATTMERTADALHDASATANTFSLTLHQGANALPAVSTQLDGVRSDLTALEQQLRSVSLLGQSPLSSAADTVAHIATSLGSLDTQLSLAAVALTANSDALATNATSLGALGDSAAALAGRLRSGVIDDSLGDVQLAMTLMLLVFVALSVVPAVGALVFGVWLRRELAAGASAGAQTP